jgi:hypothetical protein
MKAPSAWALAFVLCELFDRPVINITQRDPSLADPMGKVAGRFRITIHCERRVAQANEVAHVLLDPRPDVARIHMRPP